MVEQEVTKMGPLSPWPYYAPDEIAAATRVYESGKVNYWTGQEGREFERELASYCGAERAIVMMNGSVTIEAALRALGIGPGDEVICTPRSFMASASSVVLVGAKPVFADIDCASGNITAETVSQVLTAKTKAIIPVHLAGWPCEMDELNALGVPVIEDAAQAQGARYRGRKIGSLSVVASWSFCQDKTLSTGGEGGAITTSDAGLWDAMWSVKDHGKKFDTVYNRPHAPGFRWLHESFGSNWRMTEPQAAIGRVQLRKLDEWVATRRRYAGIYDQHLSGIDALRLEHAPEHAYHSYYKYYFYVRPEALAADWSRDRIMMELNDLGVPCTVGSCSEMYLEKNFQDAGLAPAERLPVARELGETSLMLVVHPTLSEDEIQGMAERVASICRRATR